MSNPFNVPLGAKVAYIFSFRLPSKEIDGKRVDGEPIGCDGVPDISTTLGKVVSVEETPRDAADYVKGSRWTAVVDPGGPGAGSVTGLADVDLGGGKKPLEFGVGSFIVPEATPMADHVIVEDPAIIASDAAPA